MREKQHNPLALLHTLSAAYYFISCTCTIGSRWSDGPWDSLASMIISSIYRCLHVVLANKQNP